MMFLLILSQIRLDFHFQTDRKFNIFKEIQKLAYDALQNQVQERITADEKRIENELIARRDIMKIKFNLKIENMMFSMAIQSGQFLKLI